MAPRHPRAALLAFFGLACGPSSVEASRGLARTVKHALHKRQDRNDTDTDTNTDLSLSILARMKELREQGRLGITSEFSNVNDDMMADLETPESIGKTFRANSEVKSFEDLATLHQNVAEGLKHDYALVTFSSPEWHVETDFDGVEVPYMDQFRVDDSGHGHYIPQTGAIMLSSNPSSVLEGMDWAATGAHSKIGFGKDAHRVSDEEVRKNADSKHLVVYINFGECMYFAHALANVLPRVASLLEGARDAGYRVSAVVPSSGRSYYSANTEKLLNHMGVSLFEQAPSEPHKTALVSQVPSWNPQMKQLMRQEFRRGIMNGVQPAKCDSHDAKTGVFMSRAHGANNGRWMQGSDLLETKLKDMGFEVKDNLRDVPIEDLAKDLYTSHCILAGFAGGNLLNLVFLPDKARVVEWNPSRIYADRWLFVKAFGLDWRHSVPTSGAIDEALASKLAGEAVQ